MQVHYFPIFPFEKPAQPTESAKMPPSLLSALSEALLPPDASEQELRDVDWAVVSEGLAALQLSTQEELAQLLKAREASDPDLPAVREQDDVLSAAHAELKALQPQLTAVEQHFLQLESISRPGLTKLQRLQSRANYLQTAVQVERLSQEARTQAVQASPAALEAFRAFAAFATAVPEQFSAIRVGFHASKAAVTQYAMLTRRFHCHFLTERSCSSGGGAFGGSASLRSAEAAGGTGGRRLAGATDDAAGAGGQGAYTSVFQGRWSGGGC
jgi:hypothetical protein